MSDPDAVAKAFTDHYYSTFDTNRPNLASLYQDQSILTFEWQKFQGTQQITEKLGVTAFSILSTPSCVSGRAAIGWRRSSCICNWTADCTCHFFDYCMIALYVTHGSGIAD